MTDATTLQNRAPGAVERHGFAKSAWKRLRRDRYAMISLYVIAFFVAVSYLAPVLANDLPLALRVRGRTYFPALAEVFPFRFLLHSPPPRGAAMRALVLDPDAHAIRTPIPYSPYEISLGEKLQPPNRRHWLGTDNLGRDVTARMVYGAGISLRVGLVAVGIALTIGLVAGALAGFYGGVVDMSISRLIEIVMCFPSFFLILAVIAFLPPSIYTIMVVIGLTRWTPIARYARGEFLRLKNQDFAFAARALGASDRKIIFKHLLPNSIAPVLVSATFGIANAILIEAALSFLGLGVQPPTASWGGILALAREYIDVAWWLATFPGLAIFFTVTAYNVLGEGLRDASDPRHSTPARS
jgi:peptide/nickel transport system permease protein